MCTIHSRTLQKPAPNITPRSSRLNSTRRLGRGALLIWNSFGFSHSMGASGSRFVPPSLQAPDPHENVIHTVALGPYNVHLSFVHVPRAAVGESMQRSDQRLLKHTGKPTGPGARHECAAWRNSEACATRVDAPTHGHTHTGSGYVPARLVFFSLDAWGLPVITRWVQHPSSFRAERSTIRTPYVPSLRSLILGVYASV